MNRFLSTFFLATLVLASARSANAKLYPHGTWAVNGSLPKEKAFDGKLSDWNQSKTAELPLASPYLEFANPGHVHKQVWAWRRGNTFVYKWKLQVAGFDEVILEYCTAEQIDGRWHLDQFKQKVYRPDGSLKGVQWWTPATSKNWVTYQWWPGRTRLEVTKLPLAIAYNSHGSSGFRSYGDTIYDTSF
jgi:hypothetical protein